MHSTRELSPASFAIEVAGRPARLEDVLPGFTAADRLGVVVRRPGGAVGASLLILAAVTGFYAIHRRSGEDFFIYPDYFVFHVGGRFGDHRRLEIWPSHKEVVVEGAAEQVLEAVNDRGITRLLVEDGRRPSRTWPPRRWPAHAAASAPCSPTRPTVASAGPTSR